ncbi:MAG TPA: tripartite tricarboxylate transporter substrate-binding protein, partial [Candidatus Acidoferrales bacterium]|nr:tripartite tricarboxylate transporter substrate-binding protein [Candidatus Acidoferrales bacterium]
MANVDIVRVAYKGTAPVITALVSGEVQLTIADPGLVAPHVKLGRLKALAVTSAEPSALAPGLPTVAASG